MKTKIVILTLLAFATFAQKPAKKDYLVSISTDFGQINMILYDDAPLHKANFLKLVKAKFYDSLLFHRIIENFMIQGGDPTSRNANPEASLGNGGDELERIPFEFKPNRIHKKGTLAAARDGNPEKKSSACQFYIVQGKKFNDPELDNMQKRNSMNYTPEQREIYKTLGGTPHLDNNYTTFGEVIGGLAVVDSVAHQAKNQADRPLKNIKMNITAKKMSKKKITKLYGFQF